MKLVYMGTPEFAVPALKSLHEAGHEILCVVTQPDRGKGRGRAMAESPVSEEAKRLGIETVLKPERIKTDEETISTLKGLGADLFVVCAYGQILSEEILFIPKYGCVNIHASLLPEYRGAAPILRCIMDGKEKTGISIMQMEKGLDTGPVFACESTEITDEDTGETLRNRLSLMGADLIVSVIPGIADGTLKAVPQNDQESTYAQMLTRDDARINWRKSAADIWRQVRALSPKPGAFTTLFGSVMKVKKVSLSSDSPGEFEGCDPGTVISADKGAIVVLCGHDSVLSIERLQLEGRKEMDSSDFLRGYRLDKGAILI